MTNLIFNPVIDESEYVIATYFLESKTTIEQSAWELAIGQSVGNPNVRNEWETDELFIKYSCKVMHHKSELQSKSGVVKIAFPIINTNWEEDGISHLLCQLMGGQMDIDNIIKCHLLKLDFPDNLVKTYFKKPKQGIDGIRKYTNTFNKPLLGGIVKPKTGISPDVLLSMVKQMVEGGVNFIKEDEILSNPAFCPIHIRVPLIMDYINQRVKEGRRPSWGSS